MLYINVTPITKQSDGTVNLTFIGSNEQRYTFAAGTTQSDVVISINAFTFVHGLSASINGDDFARVKVQSIAVGSDATAGAVQACCDIQPLLYESPVGGTPMYELQTFGMSYPPADLNCDGLIDVEDLIQLLAAWGPCEAHTACPADLSGDGHVHVADLLLLLNAWTGSAMQDTQARVSSIPQNQYSALRRRSPTPDTAAGAPPPPSHAARTARPA